MLLALALALAAVPAPGLEWHTIHSDCCDVHYPKDLENTARRIATIADESVKNASGLLQSAPAERIQVVIHDVTDSPNGFTNVVPYDDIDLRMITPEEDSELAQNDEYLRLLVQHEILHVVHLDTIHGVPAIVNLVVGKVWPPNIIQPRFVVEGLAVFAESKFTTQGRLRSNLFKSDVMIAALLGDLWQLDDLSSYSRRNPGGGAAYAYGSAFVAWLADKYGPGIWAAIANDYGGSLIPFAVQRSIEAATGHDVEDDYARFLDDVRAQADALRAAAEARGGPTKARRLTRVGGAIHAPRFLDDGTLVAGVNVADGAPGLYAIRGLPKAAPRLEPLVRTTEAVDVAVLGGTLVFSQVETTRGFFSLHDLWRVDAADAITGGAAVVAEVSEAGAAGAAHDVDDVLVVSPRGRFGPTPKRVTREARLRAPAPVPHTRLVVAEQRTATSAALVLVDVDTGKTRDIIRAHDGTLFYTPDVAPDAKHIACSRWSPGGARQIVEIDLSDDRLDEAFLAGGDDHAAVLEGDADSPDALEHIRVLTDDGAQNMEPSYVPAESGDGAEWILFTSDREGMFSIFAVDRLTFEVRRIVDSLGLAKYPRATPDGKGLVYVDTGLDGNDLYAAALDINAAPLVEKPASPAPRLREPTALSREEPERYNAFPTLLPHYWIPVLATDPAGGTALGAAVVGADAVGQLSLALQGTWGFAIGRPRLSGTLRLQDLWTPVTVSAEWRTDRSDRFRRNDGQPEVQQESVFSAGAALSVPLLRSRRFLHSLSFGYEREFHVVETGVTSAPDARAPVYGPDLNIGAVTVDWGYSSVEQYRDSVSNERGFTSFLRLRHASRVWTFSNTDLTEVSVDARDFIPVPGLGGHVIGLYAQGAVGFGDPRVHQKFFVGGFGDRDITRDLLTGARSGGGVLRGYPQGLLVGDALTFGSAEYRVPLLEVEHGVSTLPLFLDRVHAAAFTDIGMAFDGAPVPTAIRASVGVELRCEVVLAYYGLFLVRVGYARGVSAGGVDQPYAVLGFPY